MSLGKRPDSTILVEHLQVEEELIETADTSLMVKSSSDLERECSTDSQLTQTQIFQNLSCNDAESNQKV